MKYMVYLMDMVRYPDEWVENSRIPLGSLTIGKDLDAVTDKDIIKALFEYQFVDLMGRQKRTILTTDRRKVYAEDLYRNGKWWEVGAVRDHQPLYALELAEEG